MANCTQIFQIDNNHNEDGGGCWIQDLSTEYIWQTLQGLRTKTKITYSVHTADTSFATVTDTFYIHCT